MVLTSRIFSCSSIYMMIPTHEEVIKDIDAYIEEKGLKSNAFGEQVLNDSGFMSRLRKGLDPRLSTVIKIYKVLKGE